MAAVDRILSGCIPCYGMMKKIGEMKQTIENQRQRILKLEDW